VKKILKVSHLVKNPERMTKQIEMLKKLGKCEPKPSKAKKEAAGYVHEMRRRGGMGQSPGNQNGCFKLRKRW